MLLSLAKMMNYINQIFKIMNWLVFFICAVIGAISAFAEDKDFIMNNSGTLISAALAIFVFVLTLFTNISTQIANSHGKVNFEKLDNAVTQVRVSINHMLIWIVLSSICLVINGVVCKFAPECTCVLYVFRVISDVVILYLYFALLSHSKQMTLLFFRMIKKSN